MVSVRRRASTWIFFSNFRRKNRNRDFVNRNVIKGHYLLPDFFPVLRDEIPGVRDAAAHRTGDPGSALGAARPVTGRRPAAVDGQSLSGE